MTQTKHFLIISIPYAAFVAAALTHGWHDAILTFTGPFAALEATVWLTWLTFGAYTALATARANLFDTLADMTRSWWGRQIGADLYIGVALFLTLIALHEGSALVALAWLLPALAFANLATLLYLAIHFDSIIARFL